MIKSIVETGMQHKEKEMKTIHTDVMLNQKVKKYLLVILGTTLTALGISVFYTPNKIVNGGASGIATILFHTLGISTGLTFFVLNLVLIIIALKILGKKFVIDTVFVSVTLSLLLHIFSYIPALTNDKLLSTVFGSVLYGFGIGLTLSQGASTGGTDIVGRLAQHFFPHIRIGTLLLIADSIIITSSLIIFKQIDLALYGILALFISSYSINWLIQKLNISKFALVVTAKGDEISQKLITTSPRGTTLIDAVGAYTQERKQVLLCAMKESETVAFQKKILDADSGAFVIFLESQQILGNGFKIYR